MKPSSAQLPITAQASAILSLPAQPFVFPSDRQFRPLYAHCNSQRPVKRTTRHRSSISRKTPSRQNDLRTADTRRPLKQRRSSFALSAAYEWDGRVEFVVSPKLPSTPRSASSISTTSSVRSRMKAVLVDLVHAVKAKCGRSLPRINVVEPTD